MIIYKTTNATANKQYYTLVHISTHHSLLTLRPGPRPRSTSSTSSTSTPINPPLQSPLLEPDPLDAPAIIPGHVPIPLCAVVALGGQTAVDVALDVVAVAEGFVEEAARVAFVQGGHDLFAVWTGLGYFIFRFHFGCLLVYMCCSGILRSVLVKREDCRDKHVLALYGVCRWECIFSQSGLEVESSRVE